MISFVENRDCKLQHRKIIAKIESVGVKVEVLESGNGRHCNYRTGHPRWRPNVRNNLTAQRSRGGGKPVKELLHISHATGKILGKMSKIIEPRLQAIELVFQRDQTPLH